MILEQTSVTDPKPVTGKVLIADDDAVTLRLLSHYLQQAGQEVVVARDGQEAIDLAAADIAVAIVDLQMPRKGGIEVLEHFRQRHADVPVLVISQFGEIRDAVDAIKRGASEYITKPIDGEELLARVDQLLKSRQLASENRQLREAVRSPMPSAELIGVSTPLRSLLTQVDKIAGLDSTVLITGESGTGKSTLARRIHLAGPRAEQPFVCVSCAALPRDLLEAELFGHVRGAFTGAVRDRPGRAEMADGGTLFLDEIGDLPLELQPKLLNFLQDRLVQRIGANQSRHVDVRVVAATHQDLRQKIGDRSFREDLYFRLNVLPLHLPPLRERPEDIVPLSEHLLARIARQRKAAVCVCTPKAHAALRDYGWPGNVRELENILERASAFCEAATIDVADLGLPKDGSAPATMTASLAGQSLADIERRAIIDTLEHCGGNKRAAARLLGIDEKSIYNKIKRLGIAETP